jgi:integrase
MHPRANKRKLNALDAVRLKPQARAYLVWDTIQRGLALQVQPTGHRSYKFIFNRNGRTRWVTIGAADAIGLADARRMAAELMLRVLKGEDPAAEKQAKRGSGTFAEIATRYVTEYSQKRNKSWTQADTLIRRYVLPTWEELDASAITRSDVRALLGKINGPVLANQVLASMSAIFTWAGKQEILTHNPCRGVERHATTSRERVLSDTEVPLFWKAFGEAGVSGLALKVLLLCGQRPGEVAHLHRAHIKDNWWEMPGQPDAATGWMGTKNSQSHRVWLSQPVREIIERFDCGADGDGYVFGPSLDLSGTMRSICRELNVPRATPHDLRRTCSTTVTGLGFGTDPLNRVTNHREGGIASVYDRHGYAEENRRVMENRYEPLPTAGHVVSRCVPFIGVSGSKSNNECYFAHATIKFSGNVAFGWL